MDLLGSIDQISVTMPKLNMKVYEEFLEQDLNLMLRFNTDSLNFIRYLKTMLDHQWN